MSFNKSASPLRVKLQPSKQLLLLISPLYLGAFCIVVLLDINLWLKVLLDSVLLLSYLWTLASAGWIDLNGLAGQHLRMGFPSGVQAIVHTADDKWRLILHDGRDIETTLDNWACVTPVLSILNFSIQGEPWYMKRRAVVLLPDGLDAEDFRRLRILLMTQRQG